MNTINLPSSNNPNTLVEAIILANQTGAKLNLLAGSHLTKPGHNQKIPIGKKGLHITGSLSIGEFSSIKRPDNAIDLLHSDSNYGLFFVPSAPTPAEWVGVSLWKTYTNEANDTIEYAVITRGSIKIENLEINCNMGNQGLPTNMASNLIEHSAMIGFAGQKYSNPAFPNKFIFVGFESITFNNIRTNKGGYADDIWISRGYFRPNIGKVSIKNITSQNRINEKRATISFSGLTQKVEITNANIFKLEAEETSGVWKDLPGDAINPTNQYSFWKLDTIVCEYLDLAAKGKAIFLNAKNIKTSKSAYLYQIGGLVQNCTFIVPAGEDRRLFRLNAPVFKKVTWLISADANGKIMGLSPRSQYGDPCSAIFERNTFKIKDNQSFNSGFLIETEYSTIPATNAVNLELRNCVYDNRVGSLAFPNTHIAKVHERGHWKFRTADFGGIPQNMALLIKPTAITTTNGGFLEVAIP